MSGAGIEEILNRSSLNSVRHPSHASSYQQETFNSKPIYDRNWWWGYLRDQFKLNNLEELYLKYLQRLNHGYFSVFLLLQSLLSLTHLVIVWIRGSPLPDAIFYGIAMVLCWPLVFIVFKERLVQSHPWISPLVSCFIVLLLIITDLGVTLFHARNAVYLRPAYTTHTLLVCYVFLPLTKNKQAFILGLIVTLSHLVVLGSVTYDSKARMGERLASDIVYLLCVNGLGLYFRLLSEVTMRQTFLDRRACLESNSKLEYEKQQEENLMLSIIPRHIIDDVRRDLMDIIQNPKPSITRRRAPFSDIYVKEHKNVSILYADVVKYALLTVSLPVNKLVETLNELFGRFDAASEEHGVMRIKFLGDCYYCVSGVPDQTIHHARNCVDLGLDMIAIIKKVREERKLKEELDMRIGIHSGKILSGLLGVHKWQYDIWSRDAIIASSMEQAGEPGRVHITKETLNLLDDKYRFVPGFGRRRNEILEKYNIETFFILSAEHSEEHAIEGRPAYIRRYSAGGQRRLTVNSRSSNQVRRSINDPMAVSSRRRIAFTDDNLYNYQEALKKADDQMDEAIKNMRVGVYDQWLLRKNLNPVCLTFENIRWELPFLQQPDPLFKFYIGCALFILLGMLIIHCLSLPSSHWLPWIGYGVTMGLLLVLLPLTWTHCTWNKLKDHDEEQNHIPEPSNKYLSFLYQASLKVVQSPSIRTALYLVVCISLTVCTMLELIEREPTTRNTNNSTTYIDERLTDGLEPWHITQICSLTLMMTFLFLRIHFLLKFILSLLIVVIYSCGVYFLSPEIFEVSETWNPDLEPQLAHVLNVAFLTLTLHLMDRQAEYMNRLTYKWKRQLSQEQEESTTMHMINKLLLENILPVHVASWFLNTSRDYEELYHEEYHTVAVMFASLTEYALWDEDSVVDVEGATELGSIKLFNQIICAFDKLLYEDDCMLVEKIKVAGWTYMAACGIESGRRDSIHSFSLDSSDHVVLVLTRFAAKMMGVLQQINRETFQNFRLRVGISHGKVTAGVIGAQKPHYDIWGHSVNMASRMESTGEPGIIQVTENTAQVLQQLGIDCSCRGKIKIKSMPELVTTYFVHLDEEFQLQQTENVQYNDQDSVIEEYEVRDYEQRFTEELSNDTQL